MAVIIFSAAVFVALILYIALEQDKRERFTGITFFLATTGGILLYGFSYATDGRNLVEDVSGMFKTLVDVGRMFVGMNNEPVFARMLDAKGYNRDIAYLCFWSIHFLAYYSMASAAILTLGKGAARKVQLWLLNIRDVQLLYGITDSSLSLGRHMASNLHYSVVFVGQATSGQELAIRQMKALLLSDEMSTQPQEGFLERININEHRGRLKVYAISQDGEANYNYSHRLMKLLEKAKVPPKNTSLILLGKEERHGNSLQAYKDHYGYGDAQVFDAAELTARLLMQKFPISGAISFDDKGRATKDVRVLMAGFGRIGQEILRKIVANGQFEGSSFSVDVFDPECARHDGFYQKRYAAMLETYDIRFHEKGGRSREFCGYLEENAKSLTYIVVSIGTLHRSRELAEEITELLSKAGRDMPVYVCSESTVICYHPKEESIKYSLHDLNNLFGTDMDKTAMEINHYYQDPEGSARKQWLAADYFSRMSCRASADFLSAYIRNAISAKTGELDKDTLENFARTEHLRWNAFHFSMGYSRMDDNEWEQRAEEYKRQKEAGEEKLIRISKNPSAHHHACLVSWDELDVLSAKENAVTGGNVDYKQMDRENVVTMMKLLGGDS